MASTVTAGDIETRSLRLPFWLRLPMRMYVGLLKPKRMTVLGQELAGEVIGVGDQVKRFKVGDRVFAATGLGLGGYAQYKAMAAQPQDGAIAHIPENLSYEQAAAVPIGAMEALHFLGIADLQAGQRVLINGAGGSIGTYAVQLAKHWGARVSAVDSGRKLDMLTALGADEVIDYMQEDFTRRGEQYDVILDVVGLAPFGRSIQSLTEQGKYIMANPRLSKLLRGVFVARRSAKRVMGGNADYSAAQFQRLCAMLADGTLTPVIDQVFPMERVVEAHKYVEAGQKQGNVVIAIDHS